MEKQLVHMESERILHRSAVTGGTAPENEPSKEDLERINRYSQVRLGSEDVYIRSMYLCSDRLCESDWGRFSQRALGQIARLVVGRAVLRGHDRGSLPLGRFFRAEVTEREGDMNEETGEPCRWVRAWFYWLRGTTGAEDLLRNIDGGVYREVSISWRYRSAVCSICGGEIRRCSHTPGRRYGERLCYFTVEEILDVLEGSLVYRGADREAELAGARNAPEPLTAREMDPLVPIFLRGLSGLPRTLRTAAVTGPGTKPLSVLLGRLGFRVRNLKSQGSIAPDRAEETNARVDLLVMRSEMGTPRIPSAAPPARFVLLLFSGNAPRVRESIERLGYRAFSLPSGYSGVHLILGERREP